MSALARLGIGPVQSFAGSSLSSEQGQTRDAFGYKWAKRSFYESGHVGTFARDWLFERYCNGDPGNLDEWLDGGGKIILDAGCGAGYSALLFFGEHLGRNDYLGIDISEATEVARQRFAENGHPGDFLQADLMDLPFPDRSVDMIFSEGVLHHTDDTATAVRSLSAKLKPGGRFLFYVYAKKSEIREFVDDLVREKIQSMSDEEAWEALKPLTRLGIALGELDAEIEVPEDVPLLGIKRGQMSVQRFFYWNVGKLFYRPEYSFDEMHLINFDWFRPLNCHRHTPEEVEGFCREASLDIEHMVVQEAGITVVARKA